VTHLRALISLVVGRMPSARNFSYNHIAVQFIIQYVNHQIDSLEHADLVGGWQQAVGQGAFTHICISPAAQYIIQFVMC
jgi:hypothetical protein